MKTIKIKEINELNPIQIGKYLNSGVHNHPIILRSIDGYDVFYSNRKSEQPKGENKTFDSLEKAVKFFKKVSY